MLLNIIAVYIAGGYLQGFLQRRDLCKACMDSGHLWY